MNFVRELGCSVCFIAVICTLIDIVIPTDKMGKIMNFVINVIVICVLGVSAVNLFKNTVSDFRLNKNECSVNDKLCQKVQSQTSEKLKENLSPLIYACLNDMNITTQKFNVFMDIDDKSGISIIRVQIYLNSENLKRKEEIRKVLLERTGLNVEILGY